MELRRGRGGRPGPGVAPLVLALARGTLARGRKGLVELGLHRFGLVVELEALFEDRDGLLRLACLDERVPVVVERIGVVEAGRVFGIEGDRTPEDLHGPLCVSLM